MKIDDNAEEKIAKARRRQSRDCPLLINEEGRLIANMPLIAKKPNWRPYRGDPKASLEDRMRYLQGLGQRRAVVFEQPEEPFNLGTATADEIVSFAMEQYGAALDVDMPIDQLRQRCYQISQLPAQDLHQQAEEPLPSPMGMAEAPRTRRRRSNAEEA